ncbi:uncharacterized protein K452DRAFT_266000 [Aplosporella prunicola CBS 121167]|uniref:MOSC domain-containing protein n=1 Tax=Aplosporella prunicola CBS 121167 TaxID=1176127 RepID=A0A6A6BNK1_9PEZI|nr:uncharacterized protein K452DRAFT_266000 [Aplosporella prunicola CBS 121167]KAF2145248.1 hypothetical protein K452DRAFT_266000 [Aplosporella prunicola CBS 121167]
MDFLDFLLERSSTLGQLFITINVVLILAALYLDFRRKDEKPEPPAGCTRLGIEERQSNLRDQFDSKYSRASSSDDSDDFKVKALCVYPIKSCAPVELGTGEIVRTGMKYDRQFAFAQLTSSVAQDGSWNINHQWTFVTQRQSAEMAKVRAELWVPDPSSPTYSPDAEYVKSEGCIVVSFPYTEDKPGFIDAVERLGYYIRAKLFRLPGVDINGPRISFCIPFNPSEDRIKAKKYPREKMKIWNEYPEALNMGSEIPSEMNAKLKYALGISNQLTIFRVDPERYRDVFRCAPRKGAEVDYQPVVGLADAYPLHILNLASIHDVASRLPKKTKLDAIRFRANIYITGPAPYAEDAWKRIRIGTQQYHVSCRTARCTMPNVDPTTGARDRREPYTTMAEFRRIDPGAGKFPCLGMQMVPLSGEAGEICVGDEVGVEETGEHCYIPQGSAASL